MSSIEEAEGFAARPMCLKCIRIVCSPIGNRLTAAAVFAGNGWSSKTLTTPWNSGKIAALMEDFFNVIGRPI